jgi:hypothetical protein
MRNASLLHQKKVLKKALQKTDIRRSIAKFASEKALLWKCSTTLNLPRHYPEILLHRNQTKVGTSEPLYRPKNIEDCRANLSWINGKLLTNWRGLIRTNDNP